MTRTHRSAVAAWFAVCMCVAAGLPAAAQTGGSCEDTPATITGTEGPDTIEDTPEEDVIQGLGGDDTIRGLDGSDLLCGGAGNDTLEAGAVTERLPTELTTDVLNGGPGDDHLEGPPFTSTAYGGEGDDVYVHGGEGRDEVSFVSSSGSGVTVDLATGEAIGQGHDELASVEDVEGGGGDDRIKGNSSAGCSRCRAGRGG